MDPILYPIIAMHLSFFAGALFFAMAGDAVGAGESPEIARFRRSAGEITAKFLAFYGMLSLVALLWETLQSPWLPMLFPVVIGLGVGVAKFQGRAD